MLPVLFRIRNATTCSICVTNQILLEHTHISWSADSQLTTFVNVDNVSIFLFICKLSVDVLCY